LLILQVDYQRFIVDIAGRLPIILCVIDADDSSLERSYIYAGAQPIGFYEGDYTDPAYIYLHDRLGSVRQVFDESGNVKNTYTYTPFGTDPNSQFAETVDNPFMFTGQWFDSEIDQYYLRARMYDPQLMRFTAIDPVIGKPYHPLTLHRFLYCGNDPENWIDPSGNFSSRLVDSVVTGAEFHRASIGVASYGVASGNMELLGLGIILHEMTNPAMGMTMMSARYYGGGGAISRSFNADQNALIQLSKDAKRLGITEEEAETMLEWAEEYNVAGFDHINTTHWEGGAHIRIGPINHIKVFIALE